MRLLGIDHVVIRARDSVAMERFYVEVLGCTVERRQDAIGLVQLRAGAQLIDLVDVAGRLGRMGGAAPGPDGHNMDHLCLRVIDFVSDFSRGDLFDFSALDANATLDGDQAFSLVSQLSGAAGQIMVSSYSNIFKAIGALGGVDVGVFGLGGLFGHASVVWGDLDGDAVSDFAVLVTGGNLSTGSWLL